MKKLLLAAALVAAGCAQTPKNTNAKPAPSQSQAKEETTPQKDPVCGMTIDPKTADGKYAYKGKMYYFCSKEDQQEFMKSPDKYAAKK
jgi:Cu+-exporting ATPase